MKHLIYFFLLFSTVVFSQNYNYGIDEPQKQIVPVVPIVNNQLEEIEYFKAYLLPITKKAILQSALDTYGSVRLEKGDYSGVNIVMKSNQRLYGHPSLNLFSNITIAAGSSGVVIENLLPMDKEIIFQAGGIISNCTIKSIKWATLKATNAMLINNTFINYGGPININCSSSGYFRNNKFIRHQSGGLNTVLTMKGNSATPSYGNVNLWSNYLTPNGNTTNIDNLQSATFVGLDAEVWNYGATGTLPMLYMKNMGDVKITDLGGGNSYSPVKLPTFDIDANNLLFLNKYIQDYGTTPAKVGAKTNVLFYEGEHDNYVRGSGTVTGFDLKAHFNDYINYKDITLNGIVQNTTISNPTTISNTILGTQYTPWTRPNWETLPNPLGANWRAERVGKSDSRAYIQNLINTNKIAELPEGVFYIGATLTLPLDQAHGVTGKGTGKTVICGLTDDFPLISLTGGQDDNFVLSNLTLQGGSVGVYASQNYGTQHMAFVWLNYVVFRDQNYGIHLDKIIGFDNNFMDNLSFVNCNKAFYQQPKIPQDATDTTCFVDKTLFYNGQFINCNTAISMIATRADNLNAWVNCKFDNNGLDIIMSGNNFPIVANCDFTNNRGEYNINGEMSLYSCNFYNNNPSKATFLSKLTIIEGCDFLDNKPMFSPEVHHEATYYVLNSKITGDITRNFGITQSVFSNSTLLANPTLSKTLVNLKGGFPSVLINTTPKPYPQLLVTQ